MQVVTREDLTTLKIVVNEFMLSNEIDSKENIPIGLLRYLRKTHMRIEDGVLLNELCDLIEKKLT